MQKKSLHKYASVQTRWLFWMLAVSLAVHACFLAVLPTLVMPEQQPIARAVAIAFRHIEPRPSILPVASADPMISPGRSHPPRDINPASTSAPKVHRSSRKSISRRTLPPRKTAERSNPSRPLPAANPPSQKIPQPKAVQTERLVQVAKLPEAIQEIQPAELPTINTPGPTSINTRPIAKPQSHGSLLSRPSRPQAAVISTPTYLNNPPPTYPPRARQRGWQGDVLIRVSIDQAGRVVKTQLQKSSGHHLLDRSAMEQVRRWRFHPATQGELTLAGEVTVPIHFRLRKS